MAKATNNNPISHCLNGQGGRTFARSKPNAKLDPRTSPHNEAHKRNMRLKNQLQPRGNNRFPFGKYVKMDENGNQDPAQKEAWAAMSLAASLRERK